jgi:hypothetical protein
MVVVTAVRENGAIDTCVLSYGSQVGDYENEFLKRVVALQLKKNRMTLEGRGEGGVREKEERGGKKQALEGEERI